MGCTYLWHISLDASTGEVIGLEARINTGGISLNEMEIRNRIYRGKLSSKLAEWAKSDAEQFHGIRLERFPTSQE